MKALFGRNTRKIYPDHHDPDYAHPYHPPRTTPATDNVSRIQDRPPQGRQHNSGDARPLTTLDALQKIRRRFEAQRDQAAA